MSRQARTQFTSKYSMLMDFASTVQGTKSSIAAAVARRHFHVYYEQFIQAYETLLSNCPTEVSAEDMELFSAKFSEINKLLIAMDQASEVVTPEPEVRSRQQVMAKLPLIELPKFSGKIMEWVPFYDLFQSLVHNRDISDAEKHYYLRASLTGDAQSIVRQLPMDDVNYSVALKLLQDRYQNHRLLVDTYINQITQLPTVQVVSSLRSEFYDPLREAIQALEKIKIPVREWSYLLVCLVLQKLPMRIRSIFEERYGKDPQVLPTIYQLLELLDEQCRVHSTVQSPPEPVRSQRGMPVAGSSSPSSRPRGPRARAVLTARSTSDDQVTSCSYCGRQGHSLYRCSEFIGMTSGARKSWARTSGHCFRCLRKHYAKECTHTNWCRICKSPDHNSLLCSQSRDQSIDQRHVGGPHSPKPPSPTQVRRSPIPSTSQAAGDGQAHVTHQSVCLPGPREESPVNFTQHSRPRVGDRARQAQAQFSSLRFGSRLSPTFKL